VSLVLQLVSIFVGLALTDDVEKLVINYLSMMIVSYRDDLDRQNLVDWSQEYVCFANVHFGIVWHCYSKSNGKCGVW